MIRRRMPVLIFLVSLLIISGSMMARAEEREIYVGDLIILEISGSGIDEEVIRTAFEEFEIEAIEKGDSTYRIEVRSFEVGEKEVLIGNQQLIIQVQSLLDGDKSTDIREDLSPRESKIGIDWIWLYGCIGLLMVVSGVWFLMQNRRKKEKVLSDREVFLKALDEIIVREGDDNTQGITAMTSIFKRYLQQVLNEKIIGKSTIEIQSMMEINDYNFREGLQEWLTECDRLKYNPIPVTAQGYYAQKDRLLSLEAIVDSELKGVEQ